MIDHSEDFVKYEESAGSDQESSGSGAENEEEVSSVVYVSDPFDYTGYFENLQVIGIVLCSLIVAFGVFNAFVHGILRK